MDLYCGGCATLHLKVTLPFKCPECGHVLREECIRPVSQLDLQGIKATREVLLEEDARVLHILLGVSDTQRG